MKALALVAIWTMAAACGSPEAFDDASPAPGGDGGACAVGAVRACEPCRAGAIVTNLDGRQACEPGDGGAAWGPCRCAAEGGAP